MTQWAELRSVNELSFQWGREGHRRWGETPCVHHIQFFFSFVLYSSCSADNLAMYVNRGEEKGEEETTKIEIN